MNQQMDLLGAWADAREREHRLERRGRAVRGRQRRVPGRGRAQRTSSVLVRG